MFAGGLHLHSVSHTSDGGRPFLQQWLSEHCVGCSGMLPVAFVSIGTSTHRRISWWWWIWWQLCKGERKGRKEGKWHRDVSDLNYFYFFFKKRCNYNYISYTHIYQYSSIFVRCQSLSRGSHSWGACWSLAKTTTWPKNSNNFEYFLP